MEIEQLTQLVVESQQGNLQAMEQLMRYAYNPVSFRCRIIMNDDQQAEHLTQKVLLSLYERIDWLRDPASFDHWISTIAANHCLNALGDPRREFLVSMLEAGNNTPELLEDFSTPDPEIDTSKTCRMFVDAVRSLQEVQRICTLMYCLDGMRVKQMAEALLVSENTIKTRLSYAWKTIADWFAEQNPQIPVEAAQVPGLLHHFLNRAMAAQNDPEAAERMVQKVFSAAERNGTTAPIKPSVSSQTQAAAAEVRHRKPRKKKNTSRKILITAIALVLLAIGGVIAAAAIHVYDNRVPVTVVEETEHIHEFALAEEVPASCGKEGRIVYQCRCGETDEDILPALTHQFVPDQSSTDANRYLCQLCGEEMIQQEDVCDHNWELIYHPATCAQDGLQQYYCTKCNFIQPDSTVILPKENVHHVWSKWVTTTAPSETRTGIETSNCWICGVAKTNVLPKLAHVHVYEVKTVGKGTCKDPATQTKICKGCGEVAEETTIANHSIKSKTTPATCKDYAMTIYACEYCGQQDHAEWGTALDPNNHVSLTTQVIPATCTTAETTISQCASCGFHKEEQKGSPNLSAHKPKVVSYEKATCTTPLVVHYACEICGGDVRSEQEGSPDPNAHQMVAFETVPGNCKEPGYVRYRCEYCHKEEKREPLELDPNAHVMAVVRTDPATCTKPSVTHYACSICGAQEQTEIAGGIDSTNHGSKATRHQDPDCSRAGFDEEYCEDCGYQFSYTVLPATGAHNLSTSVVSPTETSGGYTNHYCTNPGCNYSYTSDPTPPLAPPPPPPPVIEETTENSESE